MPEDYEKLPRQAPATLPLDRRTGITQVELNYSAEEAKVQAERCLCCRIQTIYDAEKCIPCNRCVDVCPNQCLKLVPIDEIEVENGSPFTLQMHYELKDERAEPHKARNIVSGGQKAWAPAGVGSASARRLRMESSSCKLEPSR